MEWDKVFIAILMMFLWIPESHGEPFTDIDTLLKQSTHAENVLHAREQIKKGEFQKAMLTLGEGKQDAVLFFKARLLRKMNETQKAKKILKDLEKNSTWATWSQLELGFIALDSNDEKKADLLLAPLLEKQPIFRAEIMSAYQEWLARQENRQKLLQKYDKLNVYFNELADAGTAIKKDYITLLREQNKIDKANEFGKRFFLQGHRWFVSPDELGLTWEQFSPTERFERAQALLERNDNQRAYDEFLSIPLVKNDISLNCGVLFGEGTALRKLRKYNESEKTLEKAVALCVDEDIKRRAYYLLIKVVSISDGLRAIPLIEQFVDSYKNHSMSDDVLFWAGDMYQRRTKLEEAKQYYDRSIAIVKNGDHCIESLWRMAWMDYLDGKTRSARDYLNKILTGKDCSPEAWHIARAHYWLGKMDMEELGAHVGDVHYQAAIQSDPMGYYGLQARTRLYQLGVMTNAQNSMDKPKFPAWNICVNDFITQEKMQQAVQYWQNGLAQEGIYLFREIARQNIETVPSQDKTCVSDNKQQMALILYALKEYVLAKEILPANAPAEMRYFIHYPLAYREYTKISEEQAALPSYFLQALSREESVFDTNAVSWAGAKGLCQLMQDTAKQAAKIYGKENYYQDEAQLFLPDKNAMLAGQWLKKLQLMFHAHTGLMLSAYNGGAEMTKKTFLRLYGAPTDVWVEEIGIKETRHYVMRVLTTLGIYRFLYTEEPLLFPSYEYIPVP